MQEKSNYPAQPFKAQSKLSKVYNQDTRDSTYTFYISTFSLYSLRLYNLIEDWSVNLVDPSRATISEINTTTSRI